MTDKTELEVTQADDVKEYVIRKGGYFYRPKAEGYTSNANDAGRFSLKQAILHSFPNGPDGPRDGITYELATRTPDPTPVVPADGLVEALEWYADQMCEGICQGKDPKACAAIGADNCAGCPAVVALAAYRGEA